MWLLRAARMPRSKFVCVNLPGVRESVTMLLLSACSWSFNAGEAAFRSEGGFCFASRVETFIPESVNSCHLLLCSREFTWGGEIERWPSLHLFLQVLKSQRKEMTSVRTFNISLKSICFCMMDLKKIPFGGFSDGISNSRFCMNSCRLCRFTHQRWT